MKKQITWLKIKFNIQKNWHINISSFLKVWFLGLDYGEEMELLFKMKIRKICFNCGYGGNIKWVEEESSYK